ncbi:MAG TPA: histone deacetylase [Candidatus Ratteibacteria bacterium]|nr:histone deacetylase [Candidatus Ratteibacteria bacterium]
MKFEIVYSPDFLRYYEKGHPECPERIKVIYNFLIKKGINNFVGVDLYNEDLLFLAHSREFVENVKNNNFSAMDTPVIPDIYKYAFLSVCAGVKASEISLETSNIGISLSRPPGHHAGKHFLGGFCYFNGIAVAVKKIINKEKKVAVLDIDGHHGNGTEDILKMEKNVIYISIHQFPAFPGTGKFSFENCYNFPIAPGTGNKKYLEKFYNTLNIIKEFSPDIIGISLGFDTHKKDPLLSLNLDEKDYYLMGKEIGKTGINLFIIFEGGYNLDVLGSSFYCFIKGIERGREK